MRVSLGGADGCHGINCCVITVRISLEVEHGANTLALLAADWST
jgi:hypothetical protein